MNRWGLIVGLLLSLGLNIGILATLVVMRRAAPVTEELPRRFGQLVDEMALPQERREGFMVAQRNFLRDLADQRFELERLRHELRRELLSEQPDEEAVDRYLSELATRSSAIEEAFAKHVLSTRAMLDPAQEARYLEFLRRMPELRSPGRPPGMGPPGMGPPGMGPGGGRRAPAPGEGQGERRRERQQREEPSRP